MDFVGPRELDVKSPFNLTEANFTPFQGEPKGGKIVTGHAAGGFFASRQPPLGQYFPEITSFLVCWRKTLLRLDRL